MSKLVTRKKVADFIGAGKVIAEFVFDMESAGRSTPGVRHVDVCSRTERCISYQQVSPIGGLFECHSA